MLDRDVCYAALRARDERFDGRLFVGVTSTGIYCRPVCPAGPAKLENCLFYASAAAAQEAGFRPCLRCRPETAPDVGSWRGTSNTVSRGLALIAEGALDGEDASVDALAERLGVGGRQLRRLFHQHLGASPVTVAQTARVHLAKQLIHDTSLPMAEIAIASGFGSVRRFNETFRALFQRPPSALRRASRDALSRDTVRERGVTVQLRYRAPYDWDAILAFLRARAIDGVEHVDGDSYHRTVRIDGDVGLVEVVHRPRARSLAATIRFPAVRALSAIVARVRRVFDLGADIEAISAFLARDPLLAPLVAARPGLRSPGAFDSFELAVRAVLGQQVSVEAARRLASRLARICVAPATTGAPMLSLAFPTAEEVARADLGTLGMPRARRETLVAIAEAALRDPQLFEPLETLDETVARFRAIRGVGDWTAQYIALRASREPDAFPASDVGLLRSAAHEGVRPSPRALLERAEAWRPWRAYAAQHLWTADGAAPRAKGAPRE